MPYTVKRSKKEKKQLRRKRKKAKKSRQRKQSRNQRGGAHPNTRLAEARAASALGKSTANVAGHSQMDINRELVREVDGLRSENKGLRAENKGLRAENKGLRSENEGLRSDITGLRRDNERCLSDISNMKDKWMAMKKELEEGDKLKEGCQAENERLKAENARLQAINKKNLKKVEVMTKHALGSNQILKRLEEEKDKLRQDMERKVIESLEGVLPHGKVLRGWSPTAQQRLEIDEGGNVIPYLSLEPDQDQDVIILEEKDEEDDYLYGYVKGKSEAVGFFPADRIKMHHEAEIDELREKLAALLQQLAELQEQFAALTGENAVLLEERETHAGIRSKEVSHNAYIARENIYYKDMNKKLINAVRGVGEVMMMHPMEPEALRKNLINDLLKACRLLLSGTVALDGQTKTALNIIEEVPTAIDTMFKHLKQIHFSEVEESRGECRTTGERCDELERTIALDKETTDRRILEITGRRDEVERLLEEMRETFDIGMAHLMEVYGGGEFSAWKMDGKGWTTLNRDGYDTVMGTTISHSKGASKCAKSLAQMKAQMAHKMKDIRDHVKQRALYMKEINSIKAQLGRRDASIKTLTAERSSMAKKNVGLVHVPQILAKLEAEQEALEKEGGIGD